MYTVTLPGWGIDGTVIFSHLLTVHHIGDADPMIHVSRVTCQVKHVSCPLAWYNGLFRASGCGPLCTFSKIRRLPGTRGGCPSRVKSGHVECFSPPISSCFFFYTRRPYTYGRNQSGCEKVKNVGFLPFILCVF